MLLGPEVGYHFKQVITLGMYVRAQWPELGPSRVYHFRQEITLDSITLDRFTCNIVSQYVYYPRFNGSTHSF